MCQLNRLQNVVSYVKVPISSKFLFSYVILYFMQWTSAKEFFDLDKKRFFFMNLKKSENPIFLRSTRAADNLI